MNFTMSINFIMHHFYFRLLKHPNIISLVGYTAFNDELIIIMNFINGKILHHMIFHMSLANAVKLS